MTNETTDTSEAMTPERLAEIKARAEMENDDIGLTYSMSANPAQLDRRRYPMTDPTCPRCGQPHQRCTAHNRAGKPCNAYPADGMLVCAKHGAKAPQSIAARDRRQRETQARADAARFAARSDIHPADALLELVQYQAGIVSYWRRRIEEVDDADLEWGQTQHREGSGPEGPIDVTTKEAAPHIAYRLLTEAQDKLAAYSAAALKAGIQERQVRIYEAQGRLIEQAIRGVLNALNLTPAQLEMVPRVVPEQLLLLADAEGEVGR